MGFRFPWARRCVPWWCMRKRYLVNLTVDEHAALTQLVQRERVSGLKRLRASILLKADEGLTDQEIADDLEAGVATVERVRKRCCERGLEAALERKRQDSPSRPRKLDGAWVIPSFSPEKCDRSRVSWRSFAGVCDHRCALFGHEQAPAPTQNQNRKSGG